MIRIIPIKHLSYGACRYRILNRPSIFEVVVGKHVLGRRETTESRHKVAKIFMHAGYSRSTNDNDIALLKLSTAIRFTREVSPVCLPTRDVWGTMCVTTGWGLTQGEWPVLVVLGILGCFVSSSRWRIRIPVIHNHFFTSRIIDSWNRLLEEVVRAA